MNKQMFDSETAISAVLKELSYITTLSKVDKQEITDYFLTAVEDYVREGLSEEKAFLKVKARFGIIEEVGAEYRKVKGKWSIKARILVAIFIVLGVFRATSYIVLPGVDPHALEVGSNSTHYIQLFFYGTLTILAVCLVDSVARVIIPTRGRYKLR